jgi:hypothetical protein
MAFIGQGWVLSATFVDTGGNETTRTWKLVNDDDAGDLTQVIADVQTIMAAYIAATDAHVSKQTLSKTSVEDSFTLPTGDVNVEENAQISAKIFGTPNKSAVFEIPAPKATLFAATSGALWNIVDMADSLVAAVMALFTSTGVAYLSDGEQITTTNAKGKRVHHKSGKG